MHKKRCPKPEPYQDCIYWTLLARLDVEKSIQKKRSVVLGSSGENIHPSFVSGPSSIIPNNLLSMVYKIFFLSLKHLFFCLIVLNERETKLKVSKSRKKFFQSKNC